MTLSLPREEGALYKWVAKGASDAVHVALYK